MLAYRREAGDDSRVVLINFSSEAVRIGAETVSGEAIATRRVELASDDPAHGPRFDGMLEADQGLILR